MCLLFVKLAHNYVCLCNLHAVDVMQTKKLHLKKYIAIHNIKIAWKQNIICFDNILIYIFSTMHFVLFSFKGQIVLKETTIDQCFYFTFKCMRITTILQITMDKILFHWGLSNKFINFNSTFQRLLFLINR